MYESMKLYHIMVHGNIWMDITKALAYRSGSLPSLNSHHSASLACTSYTELKLCIIIVMLAFWYNNTVIFPLPCHEYPLGLQSSSVTYDNYTYCIGIHLYCNVSCQYDIQSWSPKLQCDITYCIGIHLYCNV